MLVIPNHVSGETASGDLVIEAPVGTIIGKWESTDTGRSFQSFMGLQYGRVSRRFQDAEEVTQYDSPYVAQNEGPICPQVQGLYAVPGYVSEECLYLNIYVPDGGHDLPVMFWIHGGALIRGSGGKSWYGPEFLMDKNVVLVTINYRLGALGFLSLENGLAPGNMGLRDQTLALKWLKRNIGSFGGNPEAITIFGESAGSFSVMYQVVSPISNGLFERAIAQSGAPFGPLIESSRPGTQRQIAHELGVHLGCLSDTDAALISCLEAQSIEDIMKTDFICQPGNICRMFPWDAVIDTYRSDPFLPSTPETIVRQGLQSKIPIMMGVTSEEGIYTASKYINDASKFEEINEQWSFFGPLFIFDTQNPTQQESEAANQVKAFYLQDKTASMENIHDIIDMFSDIVFWVGAHR